MIVVAIDPGVATGIVVWSTDLREAVETYELNQFNTCQTLENWLYEDAAPTSVVIERYNISIETVKKTRQTASLEIIGVARYFAECWGYPFVMQNASNAKRFMTDAKLRALGWWDRSDHIRDAYRHLGLYMAEQLHDKEVLLAGTG